METISINTRSKVYDRLDLEYLVYEKNDDGLLLICTAYINEKAYATSFTINFNELNDLIAKITEFYQMDVYDLIIDNLFNTQTNISEVDFVKETGDVASLTNYSFAHYNNALVA